MIDMKAYYEHEKKINDEIDKDNLNSIVTISVNKDGEVVISNIIDDSDIYTILDAFGSLKSVFIHRYLDK